MRTNIVIDDELKEKWWEIKREADHLNMKIGDYIIFCHDLRKKMANKDKILDILENPYFRKSLIRGFKRHRCNKGK
ncbi:MAG: hypothetical protein ACXADU_19775 [Promethearchaeota archaeon]|jgi:hypothetical protein